MRFYELLFCRVDLQNFFQSVLNNKFRKQCSVSWHLPDFVLKEVENNVYIISCFFLTNFVLFIISVVVTTFLLFVYVIKLFLLKSQYSKEKRT